MKKVVKTPAKINLCLQVNDKRKDGYHDLKMIMQAISLFDTLEFEIVKENEFDLFGLFKLPKIDLPKIKLPELPKIDIEFLKQFDNKKFDYSSKSQVNLKCNYNYIPIDDRNLVVKCVKYIFEKYGIKDKIFINLKKMIPTSGGLGGGSSDAAVMLTFINRYYKLNMSYDELIKTAAMFGSDIPFFIKRKESICEGRGEILTELKPFNNYIILLATPNVRVSTTEIFTKFDNFTISEERRMIEMEAFSNTVNAIMRKDLKSMVKNIYNDLELVTESMFSDVSLYKKRMIELGALVSLMSGSGPTVFGIFNSYFKAENCKKILKREHPDSFIFVARPI